MFAMRVFIPRYGPRPLAMIDLFEANVSYNVSSVRGNDPHYSDFTVFTPIAGYPRSSTPISTAP